EDRPLTGSSLAISARTWRSREAWSRASEKALRRARGSRRGTQTALREGNASRVGTLAGEAQPDFSRTPVAGQGNVARCKTARMVTGTQRGARTRTSTGACGVD